MKITIFSLILVISIQLGSTLSSLQNHEEPSRQLINYPISVEMDCSQVTRQLLCRVDFVNNANEDIYILKRDTPLEGIRSPYLTISQGDDVIEYGGIFVQSDDPTKHDFVLIQAGETISTSIDLTTSYKFDRDGIYTIEYTRPLVYMSNQEMSMMSYEEDLLQETHYEDVVTSTGVELVDTHNLQLTEGEIESIRIKYMESTSLEDVTANILSCASVLFPPQQGQLFTRPQINVLNNIHRTLCTPIFGLKKAKSYAANIQIAQPYKRWFGNNQYRIAVKKIIGSMFREMTSGQPIRYAKGRPRICTYNTLTYSLKKQFPRRIFLCPKFFTHPTFPATKNERNTKYKAILCQLSGLFGGTANWIIRGMPLHGVQLSRYLANKYPRYAAMNSANIAYFIQDVYFITRHPPPPPPPPQPPLPPPPPRPHPLPPPAPYSFPFNNR